MKQILIILGLFTSVTTFAQSPRIKLNQITKDTVTGSVLISSPTDSGMVYSRDLFISYGADTFLILGGDTLAATSSLISSVLSDGVTITGDGTLGSELTVDTATVIATKGDLSDYVTITGTETITGAKTFSTDVEIDGKLDLNATGNSVFIGEDAGRVDDGSDNYNVAVGYQALYSNTTGSFNTANGYLSLYSNTTGNRNIANGHLTLYFNTTGYENVANGSQVLFYNTTGYQNIANGSQALFYNTEGYQNIANGAIALFNNSTGYQNIANGSATLYFNTTGYENTANGNRALFNNTTGYQNTAIGYQAGSYTSTGGNNTDSDKSVFIGYDARTQLDSQENQIVIGYQAIGLGTNTVVLGNSAITKTRLQGDVGIGTDSPNYDLEVVGKIYASDSIISNVYAGTSDIRLKQDIEPTDKGLDAVLQLNPVSYRFIANAESEKKSYGFIAQEIEKVIPDVVGTRHDGMKVLNYNDLISVLTKAIQEQQIIIEELNQRLIKLENK